MSKFEERSPTGLQLWTIRHALERDADRALAAVKAAGFNAVELAPLPPGLTPTRLVECLRRFDLNVLSIHGDLPTPDAVENAAALARQYGCSRLVWHGWPRDPRFDTLAGVEELGAACNAANALARDHGLEFGMHNHWWEFEPVEGTEPIRIFHEMLDASVFWQLDVYWAQTAGAVPAKVLAELSPRVKSIHWKDGPCVHGKAMTALGEGNINVRRILDSIKEPADWIVELDECADDPLEAARRSLVYLDAVART